MLKYCDISCTASRYFTEYAHFWCSNTCNALYTAENQDTPLRTALLWHFMHSKQSGHTAEKSVFLKLCEQQAIKKCNRGKNLEPKIWTLRRWWVLYPLLRSSCREDSASKGLAKLYRTCAYPARAAVHKYRLPCSQALKVQIITATWPRLAASHTYVSRTTYHSRAWSLLFTNPNDKNHPYHKAWSRHL